MDLKKERSFMNWRRKLLVCNINNGEGLPPHVYAIGYGLFYTIKLNAHPFHFKDHGVYVCDR